MNEKERDQLIWKCIDACKADDLDTVKACVKIDPTIVNQDMGFCVYTVFSAAVDHSERITEWLLEQGNNFDGQALHFAVIADKADLLKRMIQEQNLRPKLLSDFLKSAARREAPRALTVLLEQGADPNHREGFGGLDGMEWRALWHRSETGLHLAARRGDVEAARILRDAGADPSKVDAHCETPLAWFSRFCLGATPERECKNGTREEMFELLSYENLPPTPDYDLPPLVAAAESGDVEKVRSLLDAGGDPNEACKATRETALHQAVTFNHTEIVKLLLAAGADPNAKADFGVPTRTFWRDTPVVGETPFHRAVGFACRAIIFALHEAGADKNLRDANHEFALTWFSRTVNWNRHEDITERDEIFDLTIPDPGHRGDFPVGHW